MNDEALSRLTEPRESRELRGYYENQHGEVWFVSTTPARLMLTGNDVEWREYTIMMPNYGELAAKLIRVGPFDGVPGLPLLNEPERMWLIAACLAAKHHGT